MDMKEVSKKILAGLESTSQPQPITIIVETAGGKVSFDLKEESAAQPQKPPQPTATESLKAGVVGGFVLCGYCKKKTTLAKIGAGSPVCSDCVGKTLVRAGGKLGRNVHCPCGSGRKFKVCCLGRPRPAPPVSGGL